MQPLCCKCCLPTMSQCFRIRMFSHHSPKENLSKKNKKKITGNLFRVLASTFFSRQQSRKQCCTMKVNFIGIGRCSRVCRCPALALASWSSSMQWSSGSIAAWLPHQRACKLPPETLRNRDTTMKYSTGFFFPTWKDTEALTFLLFSTQSFRHLSVIASHQQWANWQQLDFFRLGRCRSSPPLLLDFRRWWRRSAGVNATHKHSGGNDCTHKWWSTAVRSRRPRCRFPPSSRSKSWWEMKRVVNGRREVCIRRAGGGQCTSSALGSPVCGSTNAKVLTLNLLTWEWEAVRPCLSTGTEVLMLSKGLGHLGNSQPTPQKKSFEIIVLKSHFKDWR